MPKCPHYFPEKIKQNRHEKKTIKEKVHIKQQLLILVDFWVPNGKLDLMFLKEIVV